MKVKYKFNNNKNYAFEIILYESKNLCEMMTADVVSYIIIVILFINP